MTKISMTIILASFLLFAGSCKKTEEAIDCFAESLRMEFNHSADAQNAKTINFSFNYTGSFSLQDEVEWDFGDGTKKTVSGKTAQHTYASAGDYDVTYRIHLKQGDESCNPGYEYKINVK